MVNRVKVIEDIAHNGKYDAILDVVKKTLSSDEPTLEQITELVDKDPFYITEYKDLNRWGELSSVHIHKLSIKENDSNEVKGSKEQINKNVTYLRNGEEYEVKSKNSIYMAWTGFIALPAIYVIDNMVRLFTDLYIEGNENSVYLSFVIVIVLSVWGYLKVTKNHKNQHEKYLQTQVETHELVRVGLENNYFGFNEVYEVHQA